jgi:hypothetical protein
MADKNPAQKTAKQKETRESRGPNAKAKTLLIWEGPERPYKKQDRKFYSGMISVAVVLCIFLVFAGQFALIIVLLSILFASYALYATPPKNTTYLINEDGFIFDEEKVFWEQVDDFFIQKRLDGTVINLDINKGLIKRRYLIPDNQQTLDKAVEIIEQHVERRKLKEEKSPVQKQIKKWGLSLKE